MPGCQGAPSRGHPNVSGVIPKAGHTPCGPGHRRAHRSPSVSAATSGPEHPTPGARSPAACLRPGPQPGKRQPTAATGRELGGGGRGQLGARRPAMAPQPWAVFGAWPARDCGCLGQAVVPTSKCVSLPDTSDKHQTRRRLWRGRSQGRPESLLERTVRSRPNSAAPKQPARISSGRPAASRPWSRVARDPRVSFPIRERVHPRGPQPHLNIMQQLYWALACAGPNSHCTRLHGAELRGLRPRALFTQCSRQHHYGGGSAGVLQPQIQRQGQGGGG